MCLLFGFLCWVKILLFMFECSDLCWRKKEKRKKEKRKKEKKKKEKKKKRKKIEKILHECIITILSCNSFTRRLKKYTDGLVTPW